LTAYAVNAPKELEARRRDLRFRLRNDPRIPQAPQWTKQEMDDAAARLMASVLLKSSPIQ